MNTEKHVKNLSKALDNILNEFLEGYAMVGFHAGTGELIIISSSNDAKTTAALNQVLSTTTVTHEQPPDEQEKT